MTWPRKQKILPLVFVLISQPNIYIQDIAFEQKINMSCFDFIIKSSECQYSYIDHLPSQKDFKMYLLETKTGICDPITGIPPAFVTLKCTKSFRKSPVVDIDLGRPIRINYSSDKLEHLIFIKNLITETYHEAVQRLLINLPGYKRQDDDKIVQPHRNIIHNSDDNFIKFKSLKIIFHDVSNISLKISQIVIILKTKTRFEMIFSFDKMENYLAFLSRPERVVNTTILKNFSIGTSVEESLHLLLQPSSCVIKTFVFWESWQMFDSDPQVQMIIDSDCIKVDIGPEQMKCVESVVNEVQEQLLNYSSLEAEYNDDESILKLPINTERDQYYKDDLRAGAFQFVEATGNENELPLPYQVMFWNQTIVAMTWRYPQPRILTKVRVFPVPFKLSNDEAESQQVLCFLEYWSDCLGTYKSYTQFYLSESEVCQLNLPKSIPQSAIASTWRVVLTFSNSKLNSHHYVSPRALAACMRIDSYFNSILVPRAQLALNLYSFKLSMYNQFNKSLALKMPEKLRYFTPDGLTPDNQCFLIYEIENTGMYVASWDSGLSTIDLKTSTSCCILDYSTLSMKPFIQPVYLKLALDLGEFAKINFMSESITIRFGPAMVHTLSVSTQLWNQNWLTNSNVEPPDMVVITRYVICNDTTLRIRFGQVETDEDILLRSRFLHLYCWRSQKSPRRIRIGIEQNDWIWSDPLNIDEIKSEVVKITYSQTYTLLMSVKNISSTQKQIVFSGQLVVCNMLLDHFEMKVIPFESENKNLDMRNAPSHILSGKTTAPSLLINMETKMALRLKIFNFGVCMVRRCSFRRKYKVLTAVACQKYYYNNVFLYCYLNTLLF